MPKFTSPPGYPDLTAVGTSEGITDIPLSRVRVGPGYSAYEDLFTFLDAEGMPQAAAFQGSFGPSLMAAGRPR